MSDPEYRKLVAATIHAFAPKSDIAVGALVATPDGTRKLDVQVRSSNKLTGIDVVDLPVGQKAGIEFVDAAQSKKVDIKADAMIVCSNTGFDMLALKKAKRMKIGLISVPRRGDQRVKALIEEVMYPRKVDFTPISATYYGATEEPLNITAGDLKYQGESVDEWLFSRAIKYHTLYPNDEHELEDIIHLKNPTEFDLKNKRVKLVGFSFRFYPHVKWFSQTVQLDATTGIYDYLLGKFLLPGGEKSNSYVVQGLDLETATPLSSPPEIGDFRGGLIPGEVNVQLLRVENVPPVLKGALRNDLSRRSPIDALVTAEDLPIRKTLQAPP